MAIQPTRILVIEDEAAHAEAIARVSRSCCCRRRAK